MDDDPVHPGPEEALSVANAEDRAKKNPLQHISLVQKQATWYTQEKETY